MHRDADKLEWLLRLKESQKEEGMHIDDTQRLVTEIEMFIYWWIIIIFVLQSFFDLLQSFFLWLLLWNHRLKRPSGAAHSEICTIGITSLALKGREGEKEKP